MKKILFTCAALSLFISTSPMGKQLVHPCLALEFYKYAFGRTVCAAMGDQKLDSVLFKFMNARNEYLKEFEKGGEHYNTARKFPIFAGVHAHKMSSDENLWNYACTASDMIRFAIIKNLGVQTIDRTIPAYRNPLISHETWPLRIVSSEEEFETLKRSRYSTDSFFLRCAMVTEEKTAHKVMKHFLQNPCLIRGKHVAHRKN